MYICIGHVWAASFVHDLVLADLLMGKTIKTLPIFHGKNKCFVDKTKENFLKY